MTIAKILVSPALVERGFSATHFNNARWSGEPEQGLYHPGTSDTRLDPRLAFGGPGEPDLPFFFQNDVTRFNNFPSARRARIGYSVIWSGYLEVRESSEPLSVYLRGGPDLTAYADVDGFTVAELKPPEQEGVGHVRLRPGLRRLSIRLSGSYGASRVFEAGLMDVPSGARRPFDASNVMSFRAPPWRLAVSRVIQWSSPLVDLSAIAILLWGVTLGLWTFTSVASRDWRRMVIDGGILIAIAEAFWFAREFSGRLILLDAGQDWLMYESYARDIMFHGPLMTLGHPVGTGAPYYFQALYPYFVAVAHLLFGEPLWGVYLLQRLLLTVTIFAIWSIGDRLFGTRIGLTTLAGAVWFVSTRVAWLTSVLLNEILFIPLLGLWTLSLCRFALRGSWRQSAVSGVWGGLATLARSTLLFAWPVVFLPLLLAFQRRRWRAAPLVASVVIACSVVGMATLRNWVVSGTFVPITTSFAVNFFLGNPAPPEIQKDKPHTKWLESITQDVYILPTLEFIHAAPAAFIKGLERKAAYTLGWFDALSTRPSDEGPEKSLIATWVLAVAGLFLLLWLGVRDGTPGLARAIPLMIALSQFVAVVLIFPNVYGDRLILPFYVLLLPYAAVGPTMLLSFMARWSWFCRR